MACSTGQAGVCSAGTTTCDQGAIACQQNAGPGPELCNGLDDDCDGSSACVAATCAAGEVYPTNLPAGGVSGSSGSSAKTCVT